MVSPYQEGISILFEPDVLAKGDALTFEKVLEIKLIVK